MKIDLEKLMQKKKKKNQKDMSFLGKVFTFLLLDFVGQLLLIPLIILIIMIYFYIKS